MYEYAFIGNIKIPQTDAQCDWEWKHMRCEPYCLCSLQFQWGDYHLGRSCRNRGDLSSSGSEGEGDDNGQISAEKGEHHNPPQTGKPSLFVNNYDDPECNLPPNTKFVKMLNSCGKLSETIRFAISGRLHGLNFMIQHRVDEVKDDMCTSFLSRGDQRHNGFFLDRDEINNGNDNDIMEKPIRALRKVLHCRTKSSLLNENDASIDDTIKSSTLDDDDRISTTGADASNENSHQEGNNKETKEHYLSPGKTDINLTSIRNAKTNTVNSIERDTKEAKEHWNHDSRDMILNDKLQNIPPVLTSAGAKVPIQNNLELTDEQNMEEYPLRDAKEEGKDDRMHQHV